MNRKKNRLWREKDLEESNRSGCKGTEDLPFAISSAFGDNNVWEVAGREKDGKGSDCRSLGGLKEERKEICDLEKWRK